MIPVVLFDTDCTVVAADLKSLRPGIRDWMESFVTLGYEIHMWSAVGWQHAQRVARQWLLPVQACHSKTPYRKGEWLDAPELGPHRQLMLVVDDCEEEAVAHVPFLHVEAYLGSIPIISHNAAHERTEDA